MRFVSEITQIKYSNCADRVDEHLQFLETVANGALKGFTE